jgi:hypothetical protein
MGAYTMVRFDFLDRLFNYSTPATNIQISPSICSYYSESNLQCRYATSTFAFMEDLRHIIFNKMDREIRRSQPTLTFETARSFIRDDSFTPIYANIYSRFIEWYDRIWCYHWAFIRSLNIINRREEILLQSLSKDERYYADSTAFVNFVSNIFNEVFEENSDLGPDDYSPVEDEDAKDFFMNFIREQHRRMDNNNECTFHIITKRDYYMLNRGTTGFPFVHEFQ